MKQVGINDRRPDDLADGLGPKETPDGTILELHALLKQAGSMAWKSVRKLGERG